MLILSSPLSNAHSCQTVNPNSSQQQPRRRRRKRVPIKNLTSWLTIHCLVKPKVLQKGLLLSSQGPKSLIILEITHSLAEAIVGEDEYLDFSMDSLDSDCKKMKLDLSCASVESGDYPCPEGAPEVQCEDETAESPSPECPDSTQNS